MQEIQRQPRNDRQEPCDNAKNDASHAQTRQEIQSKATLLFDRTNLTSESEWHRQDKTRQDKTRQDKTRQDKTLSHSFYPVVPAWRAGVRKKKLVHRHLHDAPTRCKLLANAACHQTRSRFQARDLPFHPLSACECRCSMFTASVKIEC